MIELADALPYCEELHAMKRFPRETAAMRAVVRVIANNATDRAHARRMVDDLLESHAEWPGAAGVVETARKTSDATARDRDHADSQIAKWRREFKTQTEPFLCCDCNGLGIFQTTNGTVQACGCAEGRPKWVNRPTGKLSWSEDPEAVLYNSDEWIERWNSALTKREEAPYVTSKEGGKKKLGIAGLILNRKAVA